MVGVSGLVLGGAYDCRGVALADGWISRIPTSVGAGGVVVGCREFAAVEVESRTEESE